MSEDEDERGGVGEVRLFGRVCRQILTSQEREIQERERESVWKCEWGAIAWCDIFRFL